jgi:hypothetical protein
MQAMQTGSRVRVDVLTRLTRVKLTVEKLSFVGDTISRACLEPTGEIRPSGLPDPECRSSLSAVRAESRPPERRHLAAGCEAHHTVADEHADGADY